MDQPAVEIDDIRSAAERLAGVAHVTPVMTSASIDGRLGARVHFKCEHLQRVGAFKFRGAYNAISRLTDEQRRQGVLTYSSGNHAQAVALACRLLSARATIVMPDDAPAVKLAATRGYIEGTGGRIVPYNRAETTREELASDLARRHALTIVPPYDHPHVIAGQGTAALELFEQVSSSGGLDALFVPCGGGGLLSGCATVAKAVAPSCRVIGVEPEAADDATQSFRTGVLHAVKDPPTIADGARTPSLGRYTFPIVLARVDDMETVGESEILSALRLVWQRLKQAIEPTAALGLAGAIKRARQIKGLRVGVVLSGGNADVARLAPLLADDRPSAPDTDG